MDKVTCVLPGRELSLYVPLNVYVRRIGRETRGEAVVWSVVADPLLETIGTWCIRRNDMIRDDLIRS